MLSIYASLLIFAFLECISGARQKRAIFPQGNPTRVQVLQEGRLNIFAILKINKFQLIAGFGIPIDLELESLTIGYVFKTQYFLPYNTTELYQQSFTPIRIQRDNFYSKKRMFGHKNYRTGNSFWDDYNRQKSSFNNSNSRWILYKSLETLMEM